MTGKTELQRNIQSEEFEEGDGEVVPDFVAIGNLSLEELMERNPNVKVGLEGLGGWKLDYRIEAICKNKDSNQYRELERLVPLLQEYIAVWDENEEVKESPHFLTRNLTYKTVMFFIWQVQRFFPQIQKDQIFAGEAWEEFFYALDRHGELEEELDTLYDQIEASFRELKITWYLRDNVFSGAINHIITVFQNNLAA